MDAIDQLGFVTLDEIQNVFTSELAKVEEDIYLNGVPQNFRMIIEYFDAIRLTLHQRAKHNIKAYVTKNPEVKKEQRAKKDEEVKKLSSQDSYLERVKKYREQAINDCYK